MAKRVDFGDLESSQSFKHSRAYHKYFKGYAERRVPKSNGKGYKIERTYIGEYYRYGETDGIWILKKVLYGIIFAAAVACIIVAGVLHSEINFYKVVSAGQAVTVVATLYLLYRLILNLSAKRLMTIGNYEVSVLSLKTAALISAICCFAVTVLMFLYKLIATRTLTGVDWSVLGLETIGGILFLSIFITERLRSVKAVENSAEMPEDANEIR